jgi:paraquat-inducible protein B
LLSIKERSSALNRANPKLIGAFVIGAVALLVIGVLLLGGGKFLSETVDARVTPMVDNLMETSTRLRATIARLQQVVDGDVVRVLQDTNKTLQEFSGAARSFRLLADYLERNPDSLVYGKAGSRR